MYFLVSDQAFDVKQFFPATKSSACFADFIGAVINRSQSRLKMRPLGSASGKYLPFPGFNKNV
jgi:hypothetical protein